MPEDKPDIDALVPEPFIFPGLIVHVPDGNPVSTTLPVALSQVGWVTVPATGAAGVGGWVLITTFVEDKEMHPAALVTVNV